MVKRFYEYVDIIIYINLDKRVDRNNEIKAEFNRLEIPANKIIRLNAIENKVGAIGCTMSHIKAMQMIQNNSWERILILEDDFNFIDNIKNIDKAFDKFFNNFANNSWDVVNLSRGAYQDLVDIGFDFVSKVNHVSTTSGYLVNRHFCDKLMENFKEGCKKMLMNPEPRLFAIDVWWQYLQKQSKWFIFNPSLGYQRDSFSDIENRRVNYTVFDKSIEFKNKSYISTTIKGGLGNQMFQIAALYGVALDNNLVPVVMKTDSSPSVFHPRPVYWDTVFSRVNSVKQLPFSSHNIIRETTMQYTPLRLPHNISFMMDGYYQTAKYFEPHRDKILELFKLPLLKAKIVSNYYEEIKSNINEKNNSNKKMEYVAIHVRRGDYLKLQHYHVVQSLNYYLNAIDKVFTDTDDVQYNFVVFSDDIPWCQENFKTKNTIFFDNVNSDLPADVLEIYLMAMMDHHIIANSSFSWWSAWLCTNNDKKVVAPKRWFNDMNKNNEISDIYCPGWYVME